MFKGLCLLCGVFCAQSRLFLGLFSCQEEKKHRIISFSHQNCTLHSCWRISPFTVVLVLISTFALATHIHNLPFRTNLNHCFSQSRQLRTATCNSIQFLGLSSSALVCWHAQDSSYPALLGGNATEVWTCELADNWPLFDNSHTSWQLFQKVQESVRDILNVINILNCKQIGKWVGLTPNIFLKTCWQSRHQIANVSAELLAIDHFLIINTPADKLFQKV